MKDALFVYVIKDIIILLYQDFQAIVKLICIVQNVEKKLAQKKFIKKKMMKIKQN